MTPSITGTILPLFIPSPHSGVWKLGPIPLRGYALAIIIGIIVAVWVSERRWVARGGKAGEIQDIAIWAVPFGLVGGRLYHVATDWQLYFGSHAEEIGNTPWDALKIWNGGLGVWGAIALGAVGAIIAAKRRKIRLWPLLDTIAPTCLLAMGIGRWGNWFNQELFGRPTDLPWGLKIDQIAADDPNKKLWPDPYSATNPPSTASADGAYATFHPTFLYECIWDIVMFFVVVWVARRLQLGGGRVLALYVMAYCLGRGAIETLRIDDVQLHNVLGLRWSDWMSIILFLAGAAWFAYATFTGRGKLEESVYADGAAPADEADQKADEKPADEADAQADDEADDDADDDADDEGEPTDETAKDDDSDAVDVPEESSTKS